MGRTTLAHKLVVQRRELAVSARAGIGDSINRSEHENFSVSSLFFFFQLDPPTLSVARESDGSMESLVAFCKKRYIASLSVVAPSPVVAVLVL